MVLQDSKAQHSMKLPTLLLALSTATAKKSKRADLGPPIYEENEVQVLVDADWDENMLEYDVYLVLFYVEGKQ